MSVAADLTQGTAAFVVSGDHQTPLTPWNRPLTDNHRPQWNDLYSVWMDDLTRI